jgi:pimeloyl-ACP methyl ester carboxylesterase
MVANTDHMIPLEQPEAVIAALRDLIEELRKGSH